MDGEFESLETLDQFGFFLLQYYVERNDLYTVQALLETGVILNAESNSTSPLHTAVKKQDLHMSNLLLSAGANVNAIDECFYSPLEYAVEHQNIDILRSLLFYGADINASHSSSFPINVSARQGNLDILELLISRGADINSRDWNNYHVLHYAVSSKNLQLVTRLIELKANLESRNDKERTPLHLAVCFNSPAIVCALLNAGADINTKDYCGETPLQIASYLGFTKIARLLLDYWADTTISCSLGITPLYTALNLRKKKSKSIVRLLISRILLILELEDFQVGDIEGLKNDARLIESVSGYELNFHKEKCKIEIQKLNKTTFSREKIPLLRMCFASDDLLARCLGHLKTKKSRTIMLKGFHIYRDIVGVIVDRGANRAINISTSIKIIDESTRGVTPWHALPYYLKYKILEYLKDGELPH
ncbi:ORF-149 [Teiidae poxvirus 1]|nr:ORF-149 [Teiidae poxvirus 1]